MKKYIFIALILMVGLMAWAQVNGELTTYDQKKVLKVWGSHFERGYAQGYLLAGEIMEVWQDYYWTWVCYSDATYYTSLVNYYYNHFLMDARMQDEALGIYMGMQASGQNTFLTSLNRDLHMEDILLMNSVMDMVSLREQREGYEELRLGCASLSSWGSATAQDPFLEGGAVITRFLDWTPNSALIANPLLVVHFPSEADEIAWANFTFPGFIGAITGISLQGNFASINMGNDHYASSPMFLTPILFDLRRALEFYDADSNGIQNPLDLYAIISNGTHLSGTIIHTLGKVNNEAYSRVIETNYSGTNQRAYNQYGNLPLMNLAATNHFRHGGSAVCCGRYANLQDSLYTNPHISAKRQWTVLSGAAGMDDNLSAVQYNQVTGNLLWSSATLSAPAWSEPAFTLSLGDVFLSPVTNQDEVQNPAPVRISIYPNPLSAQSALRIKSDSPVSGYTLYNIRGQKVHTGKVAGQKEMTLEPMPQLPAGIYLFRIESQAGVSTKKLLITGS